MVGSGCNLRSARKERGYRNGAVQVFRLRQGDGRQNANGGGDVVRDPWFAGESSLCLPGLFGQGEARDFDLREFEDLGGEVRNEHR